MQKWNHARVCTVIEMAEMTGPRVLSNGANHILRLYHTATVTDVTTISLLPHLRD